MELPADNGHQCSFYAVFERVGSRTFEYANELSGQACRFRLSVDAKQIAVDELTKNVRCVTNYCGARGDMSGVRILLKDRRTIRYTERLKNSREFRESMDEFLKKRTGQKSSG
jgi:hypothetical protein